MNDKNYRDQYFEHGHWSLKIRQTLVMLLSWLVLFTPIIITTATYLAYRSHGRYGHYFWHYAEGFQELNFLAIFLTFALGMIAVFCLTMGYIQAQRAHGLVNKWPLFDINRNHRERAAAEEFMEQRFGKRQQREQAKHFTVKPEQNLSKDQLREVINGEERVAKE
ncbi:ABC transporter permease [Limosilactobacillus sp.]|uniref:ABC transporter permease n=1 Tax=Limosilactobacillus sp. TaxID=2773925 RepID=UPI003F121F98